MKSSLEICAELLIAHGATEVFVFGSTARGSARPDSDLDLAVRGLSGQRYFKLLADLEEASSSKVDLVLLDEANAFSRHIESKIQNGWAIRVA